MKLMNKAICILLSVIITISTIPFAFANDNTEPYYPSVER